MAHAEKYHIGAIGHLCKHFERAKDENGDYIKFKNEKIDLSKTDGNYNLATFQTMPQQAFIRKRLSEVKVLKRADVKVMCSWIVTLPKILGNEERRFFEETFKFLSDRYGRENVISAYVHRDETQPHLHFAFVPVATDKKKNIQKVSAKEVLTRAELQKFHGDLDAYLESVLGHSTGVQNAATRNGNKSIDELKRGTAVKQLKETQEKLAAAEKRVDELSCPKEINPVKDKKDFVLIKKADLEAVNNALAKIELSEKRLQETDARVEAVNIEQQVKYGKLWQDYYKQKAGQTAIESDNRSMSNRLRHIDCVFARYPSFFQSFLQLAEGLEREREEEQRALHAAKRKLRQLEKGQMTL